MQIIASRADVRDWVAAVRGDGDRIGFVPTMGFLHRGHTSLIEAAGRERTRVAVSIFVNPLQFGPSEDFEEYPRDLDRDVALASAAGAEIVFAPPIEEMYPDGPPWVAVVPERASDRLCGASRPGHFRGVLTVVAKLFGILSPDLAVFGRKDYQQLVLIRRMVRDLEMPIEVQGVPTAREPDGLALSSRNRYLSEDDRRRAIRLVGALRSCIRLHAAGETNPRPYLDALHKADGTGVSLDYAELVDPITLEPVDRVGPGVVCAIAAWVGGTRLIDNAMLGTDTVL